MKEKAARFVVKKRIAILILAVALLIPSAIGFVKTFVNYDILTYLPADLDSMIGQNMLEDDFHMASTAMLVVDGMEDYQVSQLKEKVAAAPGDAAGGCEERLLQRQRHHDDHQLRRAHGRGGDPEGH